MSLRRFSRRIRGRADNVTTNANQLVRAIALQSLTTVSFATPVDTGRARANWQVGIGNPVRTELPPPTGSIPGDTGANGTAGAQAAIVEGNAVIGQYRGRGDLFISNNLDYIDALDQGSSPQADADFVTTAIIESVDAVINSPRFRGLVS